MANVYLPTEVEPKWIKKWQETNIYAAIDNDKKPKSYILIEFPYPSGERLHVGHARSYSCLDAVARKRRMQGMNVMFPMGWDAFGLPAENYAVKTGIHPAITTKTNIERSKQQALSWGLSFDWNREINTTDPDYYRWTQWIFVQLFKKGLAYKQEIAVNWCPSCKTNLANEEVIDSKCERCGTETERRRQSQWLLRITAYADRLLEGLKTVNYREDIAAQQVNWIGKKEGALVKFGDLEVFTTRIDTILGVTFIVVAPEIAKEWKNLPKEALEYIEVALGKSERERKQKTAKTGVDTGVRVWNPATGQDVPVWVADYVMMDVGTGIVMGVPAYDDRDGDFAKEHGLPMDKKELVGPEITDKFSIKSYMYHLRDWVFSRQHYWGEPIPMISCPKDGWVNVSEEQLPVKLPDLEKFQPTGTGESPLAKVDAWVNTTCPVCGEPAKRETDTMPNWAGSSWYYLRYIDPKNSSCLADLEKLKYWLPVDWYNGGMEHTTLHLLYSRFWHKVLYDLGVVPTDEPYAKRSSHGMVLGVDGKKMSKSRPETVINPDEVVAKYGADALRLYEMFMGPFDQKISWSWESLEGVHRFVKKVWNLSQIDGGQGTDEAKNLLAKLVAKIDSDLENNKFNTAVAAMMEFINWWGEHQMEIGKAEIEVFLKALAPMAPFVTEELWNKLGNEFSIHTQAWPQLQIAKTNEVVKLAVQVNGKLRGVASSEEEAVRMENVVKYLDGKKYRVVFVPGKVINLVTE